ncbi:hypothetical protein V5O48_014570 [Marasmius crinis-equi]|uniref:F-box domain-containing protein n=1 Tax=Marasmius crinis-equi TaxID=585013 RepID=A0ABR3EXA4_9AGAR
MAVLIHLPNETLQDIGIFLVESGSRNTIFSLLSVSKKLHGVFIPLAYRKCTLDFTESETARIKRRFRSHLDAQVVLRGFLNQENPRNTVITQAIRKLVIRSTSLEHRGGGFSWSNVVKLISRIANLQELVFDCLEPVPLALLTTLEERHPYSHPHVYNWTRKSRDLEVGDPSEELLARSGCLRAALRKIIRSAPNIEFASMKTRRISNEWLRSPRMTSEDYDEEKRKRTRFDVEAEGRRRVLKRLEWPNIRPRSILSLEKSVVLSKLEVLEVEAFYYLGFRHVTKHTTFEGLVELSFTIPDREPAEDGHVPWAERQSAVMSFLLSLRPLKSLSITRYSGYIDIPSVRARRQNTRRIRV